MKNILSKEWISVKKRLPTIDECKENSGWFLVVHENFPRAHMSRYDGHEDEFSYDHGWKYAWDNTITHWMPLPDIVENQT